MSFTIQQVLIPDRQGYATLDIQIEKDKITAIAPQLDVRGKLVDGQNKLLLPGFINAHTHSSEMWHRGLIPPLPLELWLAALYDFPQLDPEKVYLSALGTAVETMLSGGTSVVDHLVLIPGQEIETVAAAVRAYKEIGIRAFIAPLLQDEAMSEGIPSGKEKRQHEPYYRSNAEIVAFIAEVIEKFHQPEEGVSILVAPTGIQLCSDALFLGCSELSDRYNLCRHTHLLETKAQKILAREKYGCSAVKHLQDIGYLNDRTSLAHCVWLDDSDIKILAETQATVVHNPLSNLRLGSGIAPILKYLQAGVNVTFGCDGASSNDGQDLLEAMKIGSLLHNLTDFEYRHWIAPRQAVEMASLGGARGLKINEENGSIAVGKKADLVMYDLSNLSLLPNNDPIALLVLGRPTNAVDSVWINGEMVVDRGSVTRIDVNWLRKELMRQSNWISSNISKNVSEFEPRYRRIML